MEKTIKLSIIIPVFNEEGTIAALFEKVKETKVSDDSKVNIEKEIVIVDDASFDQTPSLLKDISAKNKIKLIRHKKNKGKGVAVATGLKNCTGDIIIIQDADLEYSPSDYKKLLRPIFEKKCKVVYGTRMRLKVYPEFYVSFLGNKLLTFATNILYGTDLSDVFVGYKVFTKEAISGINLESRSFNVEVEITAKFIKKGLKIKEVPISYHGRSWSEGKKIFVKDGLKAFLDIFKYKFKN